MLHYTPNVLRSADWNANLERTGRSFWYLKDAAVQAGYTVRGSGDGSGRFAWNGVTAPLGPLFQGSGGGYDCWRTGETLFDSTTPLAGDANNGNAWVCLEAPSGRQVLLCNTSQSGGGWQGYARIAILRAGLGGFDGNTAGAATIPALVSGEFWLFGTRATASGTVIANGSNGGRYHYWVDSQPGAGGDGLFGYAFTYDNGVNYALLVFSPVETSMLPTDTDPCVYFSSTGGVTQTIQGHDPTSNSWASMWNDQGWGGMWTQSGLQHADDRANTALLRSQVALNVSTTHPYKGLLHRSAPRWCSAPKGTLLLSSSGQSWMSLGNIAVPWPAGVRPRM